MNRNSMISILLAITLAAGPTVAATTSPELERQAVDAYRAAHAAISQADSDAERAAAARSLVNELAALRSQGLTLEGFLGALEERELLSADAAAKVDGVIARMADENVAERWAHGQMTRSEAKLLAGALEGSYGATYGYFWSYWYWYAVAFGGCYVILFY